MKNKNDKKRMLKIAIIISVLFFYIVFLQLTKIYSPITYLIGIKMPTTGMTRAWLSVFRLQLREAFEYHQLFLLGPFLLTTIGLYLLTNKKKYLKISLLMAIILFIFNLFRIV